MEEYGSQEYWDKEYSRKEVDGEGQGSLEQVLQILELYLKSEQKSDRVLHLGCGLSNLSEELWRRGWCRIVNVDYSRIAIEKVKKRDAHLHGVEYLCMDCEDMRQLPDASFDYIFEKGMLDATFCSLGSVRKVSRVLSEVARLLKPGGYFLSFSPATKECRLPHLVRPEFDWSVDVVRVSSDPPLFAFSCNKRSYHREWFFPDSGALTIANDAQKTYFLPLRKA